MAKLIAHGRQIGRIEYPAHRLAYMADGKILQDQGFGWKRYRKLDHDVDPVEAFKRMLLYQQAYLQERPCYQQFRQAMIAMGDLKLRQRIMTAIGLWPDDPDAVFADLDDYHYGSRITMADVKELCFLYCVAQLEARQIAERQRMLAEEHIEATRHL